MNNYEIITNNIIAKLNDGVIPWQRPYAFFAGAVKYATGQPYSLLNNILLGRPGEYLGFKQIQSLGGRVRQGAKAGHVFFFTMVKKKDAISEDDVYPFLTSYAVFHIDDVEGIESKLVSNENAPARIADIDDAIRTYLTSQGITLHEATGARPSYDDNRDTITMPMLSQFPSTENYYATLFHEMIHSTAHTGRIERSHQSVAAFGDDNVREELTAEIGSAMLCGAFGLTTETCFNNSVGYIQHWIHNLREDYRLFYRAASAAEKAARFILQTVGLTENEE